MKIEDLRNTIDLKKQRIAIHSIFNNQLSNPVYLCEDPIYRVRI
jgi:hypothetical protein